MNLPPFSGFKKRKLLRRSFKIRLKRATVFSIGAIFFFSTAGLIMISFARQGSLLVKLNHFLLGYFSWATILLPFIFLVAGLLLTHLKITINEPHVLVGSVLLLLSLSGLTKAGLVGREIWFGASGMVTTLGAILILGGGTLIGLVVLFNTSLDQVVLLLFDFFKGVKGYFVKDRTLGPKIAADEPLLKQGTSLLKATSGGPGLFKEKTSDEKKFEPLAPSGTKIWQYPPLSLLSDSISGRADRGDIGANAATIERTLESFGITARVAEVNKGPAVTQYALEVALGTKLSRITGLANDLALALAAPTGQIRIEAPIPGKSFVGIEVPNRSTEIVTLKQMLISDGMKKSSSKLTVALGLDVSGKPAVVDLGKMPHVLVAGATGSGKTVLLNAFIASLLFRTTPEEVRLLLIDPKRVELIQFNGVPHLLTPVIVEPEKVVSALKWAIEEMERRYKLFAEAGVRNIDSYNELSGFTALPYIVIVVDELADIMLVAPVEVEDTICRIAQMARATGIHLVVATQRPSVDVLTGLIKANIPCRISFAVSSMVDSRVIIDQPGAEKLLGRGDMLYIPPDQAKATRVQGSYVSEPEIKNLIDFLKKHSTPSYTEEVTATPVHLRRKGSLNGSGEKDELFEEALRVVCQYDRASASLLQRRLSIGYARAARILDQLEAAGVVSPAEGSKPREVLTQNPDEYLSSVSS